MHAVVDADLTLRRGEVLGLAGESCSGKSTLAYAVTRLLREPGVITKGSVLFRSCPAGGDGTMQTIDLLAAGEEQLRHVRWSEIAVVFQSALNALNPVLTIGDQLEDVLRVHVPGRTGHGGASGQENCWTWWASPVTGSAAIRTSFPGECASG